MGSRSGDRLRARGRPRGDRHYSRPRDRKRRRMRKRRPTGICEWLREHRRRGCAIRAAAGLLRAHAVRPTAAPDRVRDVQRPVGQCRRLQLGHLLTHSGASPIVELLTLAMGAARIGLSEASIWLARSSMNPERNKISALTNSTGQGYLGRLHFGLTACRELVPDVDKLTGYLVDELDLLSS